MPYPHHSLLVSHSKVRLSVDHLGAMLDDSVPAFWQLFTGVRELEKERKIHIQNLYDCSEELRDVHWAITPIMHVAILRNIAANELLTSIKAELHPWVCLDNEQRQRRCKSLLVAQLMDCCLKLIDISEMEKASVFKLFEILADNLNWSDVS